MGRFLWFCVMISRIQKCWLWTVLELLLHVSLNWFAKKAAIPFFVRLCQNYSYCWVEKINLKKSIYANEVQNCPVKLEERQDTWLNFLGMQGLCGSCPAKKTVAISPAISKNTPNDVILLLNQFIKHFSIFHSSLSWYHETHGPPMQWIKSCVFSAAYSQQPACLANMDRL